MIFLPLLMSTAMAGAPDLPEATWIDVDDRLTCLSGVPGARKMRGKDRKVLAPLLHSIRESETPRKTWMDAADVRAGMKDHPALTAITLAFEGLDGTPTAISALGLLADTQPIDGCLQIAAGTAAAVAGDDERYRSRLGRAWIAAPGPETAALLAEVLLNDGESERAMSAIKQGLRARPDDPRLRRLRVRAALTGNSQTGLVDVVEDLEMLWSSGEKDVGPTLRDARFQSGDMDGYVALAAMLGAPTAGLDLADSTSPYTDLLTHLGAQNGEVHAKLRTSEGTLTCTLFADKAPITVASFIGLSRGDQAWTDPNTGRPGTKPLYPGTVFHRVISGFMVQGGDPLGSGIGGPGYRYHDEISNDLHFDRPGRLAMANAGPGTNGSQFFITVAPTPHLERRHTIFGQCDPYAVTKKISEVPTDSGDRPTVDVVLESITFSSR